MGIVFSKVLLTPILRLGKGIKTMKNKTPMLEKLNHEGKLGLSRSSSRGALSSKREKNCLVS